jgi:asparagine synthetase B (glutamine-hydrolysing)
MSELTAVLQLLENVAVAVSGGVDSMTLAAVAHRAPGVQAEMFHAVSAAVPPEATERVHRFAAQEGWKLRIIDAQEFADALEVSFERLTPQSEGWTDGERFFTMIELAPDAVVLVSGTDQAAVDAAAATLVAEGI